MLDLRQIYDILDWSFNSRTKQPGQSVCFVIVPPSNLAEQFSGEGKEAEDSSPAHVTVGYLGNIPVELEDKVVSIARSVIEKFRSFPVCISKIKTFDNPEHTVYYSSIKSRRLQRLHNELKSCFAANQIPMDATHPDYTPHITIEYVPIGQEPQFVPEEPPTGEWMADTVWLWGFEKPHLIFMK